MTAGRPLAKSLEAHGFNNHDVQLLNSLIWSAKRAAEIELKGVIPPPIPRAKLLREAIEAGDRFLQDTGAALPDAPSALILPPNYRK